MIITKYSEQAENVAKKLTEVTNAIKKSQWRKKFAWKKVPVTVPGNDDRLTKSYAWLQWYYTRDVYQLIEADDSYSITFDIRHKITVNIPSMDTLSYAAIEHSDILAEAEKDLSAMDRWERNRYMHSPALEVSPEILALLKKDPFWFHERMDRDKTQDHQKIYESMYASLKTTDLVKDVLKPEQYNKVKLLDRLNEIEV